MLGDGWVTGFTVDQRVHASAFRAAFAMCVASTPKKPRNAGGPRAPHSFELSCDRPQIRAIQYHRMGGPRRRRQGGTIKAISELSARSRASFASWRWPR
jgi:hypothetical protein